MNEKETRDPQSDMQISTAQPTKARPVWITILCYGIWTGSFMFGVLVPVLVATFGTEKGATSVGEMMPVFALIGIVLMLIGIGLWRMKRWGTVLFVLVVGGFTVYDFISSESVFDMLSKILRTGIIAYLSVRLWRTVKSQ
jgi:hypothetical protein